MTNICELYRELITQLQIYTTTGIRILSKGYLPNTLVTAFEITRNSQ